VVGVVVVKSKGKSGRSKSITWQQACQKIKTLALAAPEFQMMPPDLREQAIGEVMAACTQEHMEKYRHEWPCIMAAKTLADALERCGG
jgi:hypothetical protein